MRALGSQGVLTDQAKGSSQKSEKFAKRCILSSDTSYLVNKRHHKVRMGRWIRSVADQGLGGAVSISGLFIIETNYDVNTCLQPRNDDMRI
jgi:hypothetical protein